MLHFTCCVFQPLNAAAAATEPTAKYSRNSRLIQTIYSSSHLAVLDVTYSFIFRSSIFHMHFTKIGYCTREYIFIFCSSISIDWEFILGLAYRQTQTKARKIISTPSVSRCSCFACTVFVYSGCWRASEWVSEAEGEERETKNKSTAIFQSAIFKCCHRAHPTSTWMRYTSVCFHVHNIQFQFDRNPSFPSMNWTD